MGGDLGLRGHCSHPNTGFFNPALPSLLLFPVLLGTNLGNTGSPQKNLAHRFFCCNFGQTCSLHGHEGAAGQHRAGDSPGRGAQSPSRKLALSTAAGGTRWSSPSHTHSLPSICTHSKCISNKNTLQPSKPGKLQPSCCHVTGDMRPFTDVANSS